MKAVPDSVADIAAIVIVNRPMPCPAAKSDAFRVCRTPTTRAGDDYEVREHDADDGGLREAGSDAAWSKACRDVTAESGGGPRARAMSSSVSVSVSKVMAYTAGRRKGAPRPRCTAPRGSHWKSQYQHARTGLASGSTAARTRRSPPR
jgi:hypothetical protein